MSLKHSLLFLLCTHVFFAETTYFRRQISKTVQSFDLHQATYHVENLEVLGDMFEGLYGFDIHGFVVPKIARDAQQTSSTHWVIRLHDKAKWSDGHPVTAHDFVYAWRRLVSPLTAAKQTNHIICIKNAIEILAGKKNPDQLAVYAANDYELHLETTHPIPYLKDLLTDISFFPLPLHLQDKIPPRHQIVSNGPFVLDQTYFQYKIELKKNHYYWNPTPNGVDHVIYYTIPSAYTAFKMYETGQLDYMIIGYEMDEQHVRNAFQEEMHSYPLHIFAWLDFNYDNPEMQQRALRKALSLVIDRETLVKQVLKFETQALYTTYPDLPQDQEWRYWSMDKRIAEARKLLASCHFSEPLVVLAHVRNPIPPLLFILHELEHKLNLKTQLVILDGQSYMKARNQKKFHLRTGGWNQGWRYTYNDPNIVLEIFLTDHIYNGSAYYSPAFDRLYHQMIRETSLEKRKQLCIRLLKMLDQDYASIRLFQHSKTVLLKSYVKGMGLNSMNRCQSTYVAIEPHKKG